MEYVAVAQRVAQGLQPFIKASIVVRAWLLETQEGELVTIELFTGAKNSFNAYVFAKANYQSYGVQESLESAIKPVSITQSRSDSAGKSLREWVYDWHGLRPTPWMSTKKIICYQGDAEQAYAKLFINDHRIFAHLQRMHVRIGLNSLTNYEEQYQPLTAQMHRLLIKTFYNRLGGLIKEFSRY